MKKSFAILLAFILVLSICSSFALLPPKYTSVFDPFTIESISVTNVVGYTTPYLAVDSASLFEENQMAYVVITTKIKKKSTDDNIGQLVDGSRTITVTSSTLDMGYSKPTAKWFKRTINGSVAEGDASGWIKTEDLSKLVITYPVDDAEQPTSEDYVMGYISFIAVTKPATAGEVKAALTVDTNKFAAITTAFPTYAGVTLTHQAFIYSSTTLKYIIKMGTASDGSEVFVVYTRSADNVDKAMFAYKNNYNNTAFQTIMHQDSITTTLVQYAVTPNTLGRLIYKNSAGDSFDITDTVNAVNSYFGFSFTHSDYPILPKYFEAKTTGSAITVTDAYAYVVEAAPVADSTDDIADTGDFSSNIATVLMASVLLAVAALGFAAKKQRD